MPSVTPKDADLRPVVGALWCHCCRRAKPTHQFSPCQARSTKYRLCRTCNRLAVAKYRETPKAKAAYVAYRRRPEVRERQRLAAKAQKATPGYRARRREYETSERGLIKHRVNNARYRLARATTADQRRGIEALLKIHLEDLAMLEEEMGS